MATCAHCNEPLVLSLSDDENDDEDTQMSSAAHTVPDDVHLSCGCHFHWECLLDAYEVTRCPACSRDISSPPPASSSSSSQQEEPRIIVTLNNEGGLQENLDIFPLLNEESYLRAYPEERKSRAFLEFCREGDYSAVVDLVKSCSEPEEDDEDGDVAAKVARKTADQVLRYQDPIGGMQSGLHAAVANGHREVAWLLLLLASSYPELEFPALVFQEAASLGIMRGDQAGKVDIRAMKDVHGRTAEDIAKQDEGHIWNGWVGNARLAMPRQSLSNNLQSY